MIERHLYIHTTTTTTTKPFISNPQELKNGDKTKEKKEGEKRWAIKNQTEKGEKAIKADTQKGKKVNKMEKNNIKRQYPL
jgi:hypothetical protein